MASSFRPSKEGFFIENGVSKNATFRPPGGANLINSEYRFLMNPVMVDGLQKFFLKEFLKNFL